MKDTREPPPEARETRGLQGAQRELPVAGARIRMLKASYLHAWLYFFLILCLLVAWAVPLHMWIVRRTAARAVSAYPHDATCFVALAYAGISDQPQDVSPAVFRAHMRALRDQGYVAVTLDEVYRLLYEGEPLPRRAVLLTFDQSRRSSYFDARGVIRRLGLHGVMFLWTRPILEGEPASLRWPYVRRMLNAYAWDIGAQSHDGFSQIPSDPSGGTGTFLTTPRWIARESRFETPDAFEARLAADHQRCIALITKETQRKPRAFAFPYGDFGQFDERAVLTRYLNLDLVARHYDLGFIIGSSALNGRDCDPHRLNRLLVDPSWGADELLQRLEQAWPRRELGGAELFTREKAWLPDWGAFSLDGQGARLAAREDTTGAKVWINGSGGHRNFTGDLEFTLEAGQLGIFLRGSADGERYIYLGVDTEGQFWLRQKLPGLQPVTLASDRAPLLKGQPNRMEFTVRDHQLHVRLNNRPLFRDVLHLRGKPHAGLIGLSVWHPLEGAAGVRFTQFHSRTLDEAVVSWPPVANGQLQVADWLNRHGYRFSHCAPPWMRIGSFGTILLPGPDPQFMQTLSRIYSMQLTPLIRLDDNQGLARVAPEILAEHVLQLETDGVLLDLRRADISLPLTALVSWLQAFHHALAAQDRQVLVRFPPYIEGATSLQPLLAMMPNLRLVSSGERSTEEGPAPQGTGGEIRVVHMEEAVLPMEDLDLSMYYELTRSEERITDLDGEMRSEVYRRQGHKAFQAGQFNHALEIWTSWHEHDPSLAEPLMLLGDASMRLGQVEQAMGYYRRSLDVNPGQIDLALRYARLLDQKDQPAEARQWLNLYARIFPQHPEIALAQAEWLNRRGRSAEASELMERVIAEYPNDLRAMVLLYGLLTSPRARHAQMREIARVGTQPGLERALAEMVRAYELNVWPEAWILQPVFARLAQETRGPEQELYKALLPLSEVVEEDVRADGLSGNWTSSMPLDLEGGGVFVLQARPAEEEAYLRLRRSENMHNGFLEVTIDSARGFFWIYARRTENSMVRFGFDEDNLVYLQVWRSGQLVANETRAWVRPARPVTLRLEVRGDGAKGYIDGAAFFHAPVSLPRDMALGWWGVAPYAPGLGIAHAAIRAISGGPLPVHIAFVPDSTTAGMTDENGYIHLLQPHIHTLSALAPLWFSQRNDGTLSSLVDVGEAVDLRIYARYHRVRLMPAIRDVSPENVDVQALSELAREHYLDGFTLLVPRMPPEEWIRRMQDAVIDVPLHLMLLRLDPDDLTAERREISSGLSLFPGARETATLPVVRSETALDDTAAGRDHALLKLESFRTGTATAP